MRDVLVFTPVWRLEPETVTALFALEWDGPLTVLFQRDNPYRRGNRKPDGHANHLHQYERGREAFLNGRYEAMLVVESDVIPPPDTLWRLDALDADVAYAVYVFRNQRNPVVNIFERYPQPARNIGESLSVRPGLLDEAVKAGIVECSGGGLGCVLIRRHVLEAVPFRLEPGGGHADSFWTIDVYRAGYTMRADMRVKCGHKDTDGTVLYPSYDFS